MASASVSTASLLRTAPLANRSYHCRLSRSLKVQLPFFRLHQISGNRRDENRSLIVSRSKFEQFDKKLATEAVTEPETESSAPDDSSEPQDSVLPNNLQDAVSQASQASSLFILSNGSRAIVELLVPDLEVLGEEGAQQLLWDSGRTFLETMAQNLPGMKLKAIFPDAGVGALLSHRWQNVPFSIASLTDRNPVEDSDDVVVLIAPDFQMLSSVQKIAETLSGGDAEPRPLIMWNPRLISGDVGIGLNVRRLRENFLTTFTSVYHLRPLGGGAIYRRYPQPWKLFLDNPERPGRYLLYREQLERPDLDDIEDLFMAVPGAEGEEPKGPSLAAQAAGIMSSLSRFMKALSN